MNENLKLSGVHFGEISVIKMETAVSILIYNPTGNAIIGLTADQTIQLRDFLNTIVGTKKG